MLKASRPYPQWNDYVVIARGNRIIHAINGKLTLDAVDTDQGRASGGLFALQLDFGKAMWGQFKDPEGKPLRGVEPDMARFESKPGPPETTPEIPSRLRARHQDHAPAGSRMWRAALRRRDSSGCEEPKFRP